MNKFLSISAIVVIVLFLCIMPLFAATYWVANDGNNGDPGSESEPWETITYGESQLSSGDTLMVKDGTYNECINVSGVDGTLGNYTIFQAENKHGAKIQCTGSPVNACFQINDNYIEINGFDLAYWGWGTRTESWCDSNPGSCSGHGIHSAVGSNTQHHFRILNNKIHNCGGAGIGTQDDDFLYIEGNTFHNNSYYNTFGQSPITLYWQKEVSGTGDDGEYVSNLGAYFRNVIRRNFIYHNQPTNMHAGGGFQEANGIILDRWDYYSYAPGILIENNVIFNNWNRGFHSFYTYNTVVRNNTFYYNQLGWDEIWTTQQWRPDFVVQNSEDVKVYNNIIYHNGEGVNNDDCIAVDNPHDCCTGESAGDCFHQALIWGCSTGCELKNNLVYALGWSTASDYFGVGNDNVIVGTDLSTMQSNNNVIAQNPLFVNPSTDPDLANFTLQSGSPAKDSGLSSVCASEDFNGNARPLGSGCDMGAYEYEEITSFFTGATPSGGSYQ